MILSESQGALTPTYQTYYLWRPIMSVSSTTVNSIPVTSSVGSFFNSCYTGTVKAVSTGWGYLLSSVQAVWNFVQPHLASAFSALRSGFGVASLALIVGSSLAFFAHRASGKSCDAADGDKAKEGSTWNKVGHIAAGVLSAVSLVGAGFAATYGFSPLV